MNKAVAAATYPVKRGSQASPTLREIARRPETLAVERCEMCRSVLGARHRHLMELTSRRLLCCCDTCSVLYHCGSKYRRVPKQVRFLTGFRLSQSQWDGLTLPLNLAFFFKSTRPSSMMALYPAPSGAMGIPLPRDIWDEIEQANPLLQDMESDVQALLVNRLGPSRGFPHPEHYLVPIDECFKLVELIRNRWKGLSGGNAVWQDIAEFFVGLQAKSHS